MALDPAITRALRVAYRCDVGRLGGATSGLRDWLATPIGARSPGRRHTPRWLADLGIRPVDVLATAAVIAAVELNVATASGPSQQPLNALAWGWGAAVGLPVLVRRRWPRGVLIACAVLLLVFYSTDRRDISPVPLLCLPLYDAAAAGFLALAIIIPAFYMTVGLFLVGAAQHAGALALAQEFLPSLVLLLLAILLGDAVRNRRALAAETAQRLRLADEEREREGARRVAEERLRIARELHDTVAHSMATIAVQAASALHVLDAPSGAAASGELWRLRHTAAGATGPACATRWPRSGRPARARWPTCGSRSATCAPRTARWSRPSPGPRAWPGWTCSATRSARPGRRSRSRCEASRRRCRPRPTTRPTGSCRSR